MHLSVKPSALSMYQAYPVSVCPLGVGLGLSNSLNLVTTHHMGIADALIILSHTEAEGGYSRYMYVTAVTEECDLYLMLSSFFAFQPITEILQWL